MWDNRMLRPRRQKARIALETLAAEISAETDRERPALVVDLSEQGLRLERPLLGGRSPRIVQVEFDIPGYDDLIWAAGEVCFDRVWQRERRLVRTSGVRLLHAAARHLRVVREYVVETRRVLDRRAREDHWWTRATGLRQG
jgi:hypothetical protein